MCPSPSGHAVATAPGIPHRLASPALVPPVPSSSNGHKPGAPRTPPRVLIVERDQQVRALQRFFLERAGFSVHFADDGIAALAHARADVPALLVTEILVPRLDGLTLCRQLRDDPLTHDVPVVVCSILSAAARAAEAGASAFLRKPLVESTFLAAVRDAIAAQSTAIPEPQ